MKRIQWDLQLESLPRPCDYFHLMGGTSTGGQVASSLDISLKLNIPVLRRLIVLMLGRLRMTTSETLLAYKDIARAIFGTGNKQLFSTQEKYGAKKLEDKIKKVVASKELGEQMLDESDNRQMGKAFVCATPAHDLSKPRRYRTYRVRENASEDCFIWEAARATTAAPTFFKSMKVGIETIIDAGLGCNNPTDYVLKEAIASFGGEVELGCLVSIGTGYPGVIDLSKPGPFQKWLPLRFLKKLVDIVTDCEKMAHTYEERFNAFPDCFFRFNVTHGAGEILLHEWEKLDKIETYTRTYLEDAAVSRSINTAVKLLCQSEGVRTASPTLNFLS